MIASHGAAGGPALDKSEAEFPPQEAVTAETKAARRRRYQLQATAAELLGAEGVAKCGRFAGGGREAGGMASIKVGARGAHLSRVLRCNSVWHCPCCAASIAAGRRDEVKAAVRAHLAAGGGVYMLTLTLGHDAFDACRATREAVALAWRYMQAGKSWAALRASFALAGNVRALEVTHGGNGWHPHLHVLVFTERPCADGGAMLGEALKLRWCGIVEKRLHRRASRDAQDFSACRDTEKAADYIAKELTLAHMKTAKPGGRSAWQILESVDQTGDERDARLWREYAAAFKGARQLTWTRGLRERYGLREESDEALAAKEPPARTIAHVSDDVLQAVARRRLTARLLEIAERDGAAGVARFLALFGFVVGSEDVQIVWDTGPPEPEPRRDTSSRVVPLKGAVAELRT